MSGFPALISFFWWEKNSSSLFSTAGNSDNIGDWEGGYYLHCDVTSTTLSLMTYYIVVPLLSLMALKITVQPLFSQSSISVIILRDFLVWLNFVLVMYLNVQYPISNWFSFGCCLFTVFFQTNQLELRLVLFWWSKSSNLTFRPKWYFQILGSAQKLTWSENPVFKETLLYLNWLQNYRMRLAVRWNPIVTILSVIKFSMNNNYRPKRNLSFVNANQLYLTCL